MTFLSGWGLEILNDPVEEHKVLWFVIYPFLFDRSYTTVDKPKKLWEAHWISPNGEYYLYNSFTSNLCPDVLVEST